MPVSATVAPRQKLPPPTTTATSTPCSVARAICQAMLSMVEASIPNGRSPIRASPLSFTSARRYRPGTGVPPSRRLAAQFETDEPAHANILACLGYRVPDEVPDGPGCVADERLPDKADLFVGALHLRLPVLWRDNLWVHGCNLHSNVAGELAELGRIRNEVGLAVHFDEDADPAPCMDVAFDDAVADLAVGALGGGGHPFFAKNR